MVRENSVVASHSRGHNGFGSVLGATVTAARLSHAQNARALWGRSGGLTSSSAFRESAWRRPLVGPPTFEWYALVADWLDEPGWIFTRFPHLIACLRPSLSSFPMVLQLDSMAFAELFAALFRDAFVVAPQPSAVSDGSAAISVELERGGMSGDRVASATSDGTASADRGVVEAGGGGSSGSGGDDEDDGSRSSDGDDGRGDDEVGGGNGMLGGSVSADVVATPASADEEASRDDGVLSGGADDEHRTAAADHGDNRAHEPIGGSS